MFCETQNKWDLGKRPLSAAQKDNEGIQKGKVDGREGTGAKGV